LRFAAYLPVSLLLLAACAGSGSSDATRCDDACARDEKCNFDQGSPYCDDECEDDVSALRTEFADAFFGCYADLRCDVDGTECEVEASNVVDRRTLDDEFQTACQTKSTDCDDSFSSDLCFVSHYYGGDAVDAANDCLALACDGVGSCLLREMPFAPFDR
jgi:hypothetical protein